MKSYRYTVVDVFTTEVLKGNALAVLPDASGLDATTMQKIAREFNLTETVFVLPATRQDCAAALRIFTPARELPFAGHPTVGGAFVLLEKGIVPKNSSAFAVEEQIGAVPIRVDGGPRPMIWLRTRLRFTKEDVLTLLSVRQLSDWNRRTSFPYNCSC